MFVEERVRKPFTTKRQTTFPRKVKFRMDPKDARSALPVDTLTNEIDIIEGGSNKVSDQAVSTEGDLVFPPTVLVDRKDADVQASSEELDSPETIGAEIGGTFPPDHSQSADSQTSLFPEQRPKNPEQSALRTRNYNFSQWSKKETRGIELETTSLPPVSDYPLPVIQAMDPEEPVMQSPLFLESTRSPAKYRGKLGLLSEELDTDSAGIEEIEERAQSPPISVDRVAQNTFKFTLPPISKVKHKKSVVAAKPKKKHSVWTQLLAAITIQTWWRKMRVKERKVFTAVVHAIFDRYLSESVRHSPKVLKL